MCEEGAHCLQIPAIQKVTEGTKCQREYFYSCFLSTLHELALPYKGLST